MTTYPVYKLPFPHDPQAESARKIYGPSESSEQIYDQTRHYVTEAFDFSDKIESLISIIIRHLAKSYKGGPMAAPFTKTNTILFGELLDVELPIETTVSLNVSKIKNCKNCLLIKTFTAFPSE